MSITRKKVLDEAHAQELLEQFDDYAGTFRAFCAEKGVDGRSLRAWQRRLIPDCPPPALELVQLTTPTATPATYRLTLGEISIELSDDFRESTLMRLLAVVAAC